jgi:hypothetical protein
MCFGGILGFIDLLCVASGFLPPSFPLFSLFLSLLMPAQVREKKKNERKKEKDLFFGQKDEKDSLPI